MTDTQALFDYRWNLALETLEDARKMLQGGVSARSVVNRAYYAMFYAVLSLFLKTGTTARTSRHSGVIGIFDAEFVKTGKLPKELSTILHLAFDDRQEYDYKDYAQVEKAEAGEIIQQSETFINQIKAYLATQAF